jgi:leucyl-tRNA synthetase
MNCVGFKDIESKWQSKWENENVFSVKNKGPKYFITFPIPYVNGGPHLGHAYTLFRVDAYARFKRMNGFDVFFRQGFHATGEPIVGSVERLKNGDNVQIETYKLFGATDEVEKLAQRVYSQQLKDGKLKQ